MAGSTPTPLAVRVHDLRGALRRLGVDADEVRDRAQTLLYALQPAGQETVPLGGPESRSPATWAPDAPGEVEPALAAVCRGILARTIGDDEAAASLARWNEERHAADPEGRYLVVHELGRGGMGVVLQADDVHLDRTVAIKVLHHGSAGARRRFIEEARLTARLAHPGVVPVHDVGETSTGLPFFAMKRVQGRSLHELLYTGELPELSSRLEVFRRVCETVAFAHDAGVLHLDLKPDNVMIGDYGEVMVVDWGLAAAVDPGGSTVAQVAGTPGYMAPEQATRGAALDPRTDVYALGAVLFELLCDQPTIPAGDVSEMLAEVRSGRPPAPRDVRGSVPAELDALVRRTLQTDPADRPASAMLLRDEVQAYQENRELTSVHYRPWHRLDKWRRRNQALVTGAVVAGTLGLATLLVATVVYGWSVSQARDEARAYAQRARAEWAEAQLLLGRDHLQARRHGEARTTLRAARTTFLELDEPVDAVDLALAELRARGSDLQTVRLPFSPVRIAIEGERLVFHGQGQAGWVDLRDLQPHRVDAARFAVTDGGAAWVHPGPDGHTLEAVDGSWRVQVPEVNRLHIWSDRILLADAPHGYQLRWTEDGVEWQRRAVDHGACAGKVDRFIGPFAACGDQRIDVFTGKDVHMRPMLATDGEVFFTAWAMRPEVMRSDRSIVWSSNEGTPAKTTTYGDGIAMLTADGRIVARTWSSGRVQLELDATGVEGVGPLAADPDGRVAAVAVDDQLHVLRPVTAELQPDADLYSHAVASSDHGTAFATDGTLHRIADEGWRHLPITGAPRDMAWSADGRLAVALRRKGVLVVAPDGTTTLHERARCCLGVAWRGQTLGAVGHGSDLHELAETWTTTELPELSKGGWDIEAWGDAGWAISDYDEDETRAFVWTGSTVAHRLSGPPSLSYDLAVHGDQVLVGGNDGVIMWEPGSGASLTLSAGTTIGVAWAPSGPVVASADQSLRFYDHAGQLLHRWELDDTVVSLDHHDGTLVVMSPGRIHTLSLRP